MDPVKVKLISPADMTNWEIVLLEDAIGVSLAALGELIASDRPKHRVYVALMWIALRRKMGDELTLQKVGEGPYELDATPEALAEFAGGADDDPKDEPAATPTGEHGEPS